jgi:hypothetical protein
MSLPSPTPTQTMTVTPTATAIICGSGVTTGEYYYYDCCRNFIKGNSKEEFVTLNYSLPYNGVVPINAPASTVCLTPTPTPTATSSPTPTPTPSVTSTPDVSPTLSPTPTPTGTPIYGVKFVNTCDPITLFPLGVECYGTDPTSTFALDGRLFLRITGGTAPYDITWANGQKAPFLFNLGNGSYQVTVVDFYGDFTASTICDVVAPTNTPTPSVTPTITPSASFVFPTLCFTIIWRGQAPVQIEFTPTTPVNGKVSYTSTSGYTIQWNPANNTWNMIGYSYNYSALQSQTTTLIPDNGWYAIGGNNVATVSVIQASCSLTNFLSMNIQTSSTDCSNNNNGSIVITPIGGVAPYQYSIDNGVTYQLSNIFTNLATGTYPVVILDNNSTIATQTVTVPTQASNITYNVGVQKLNQQGSGQNRTMTWKVNVSPALPAGVTLNLDVLVSVGQSEKRPGSGDINYTSQVKKNTTIVGTTPVTTSSVVPRPFCSPNTQTDTNIVETRTLTLTSSDVISGTSVSTLEILLSQNVNGCATLLQQSIEVSVANLSVNGCTCCTVINNQGTALLTHTVGSSGGGGGV